MDLLKKLAIAFLAVAAIGATAASGSSSTDSGSSGDSAGSSQKNAGEADEVNDVKLTNCSIDNLTNWPEATLEVTNDSQKPSDYIIEVTFESKDGKTQFGTGNAIISNLKPQQTKKETVSGLEQAKGKIKCSVSSVDRTESL